MKFIEYSKKTVAGWPFLKTKNTSGVYELSFINVYKLNLQVAVATRLNSLTILIKI